MTENTATAKVRTASALARKWAADSDRYTRAVLRGETLTVAFHPECGEHHRIGWGYCDLD